MTISDIEPELYTVLRSIVSTKTFPAGVEWESLVPKLMSRVRQIVDVHYRDGRDARTTDHIVNINTNAKEVKPEEMNVDQMMRALDDLIRGRFAKSPPFTVVRISELLLFDKGGAVGRDVYGTNPIKFLRALWISLNVVTKLEEFEKRNKDWSGGANVEHVAADGEKEHDNDKEQVKILPIQTERGGETKTVVMTRVPWIDEVQKEEDDDEYDDDGEDGDYVAEDDDDDDDDDDDEKDENSDVTDNDNDSQQLSSQEEDQKQDEETREPEETISIKNRKLDNLKNNDVNSPKTKRDQLDSPNVKRHRSDLNLAGKAEDTSDVSMNSIGDEDEDENENENEKSKEDIKMNDSSNADL